MTFYEQLSVYYDEIFAVSAEEMAFVVGLVPSKGDVLDIGCGTGNKTVFFKDIANTVKGIDLDAGMIAKARLDHSSRNVSYEVQDMASVSSLHGVASFDGIVCLGNTLVHFSSLSHMEKLICSVYEMLRQNGSFVVQILNYERIIANAITELPAIETTNCYFTRRYTWKEDGMHFVTSLRVKQTGEEFFNDIILYPLTQKELAGMLERAGFEHVEYFGSYQGAKYTADSFALIACCRR